MDLSSSDSHKALRAEIIKFAVAFEEQLRKGKTYTYRDGVKALGEAGFIGYIFPDKYGGKLKDQKYDVTALCIIREELGRLCPELDDAFVMQGLGGYPILLFGTEEQKQNYMIPTSKGQKIAAFALTEREAGSDVKSIQTTAVTMEDGYVLNGSKKFISAAGVADFYVVFAKVEGELSAFIVDSDNPGLKVTPLEIVVPHTIGELEITDCKVSKSSLIGQVGDGFNIATQNLYIFRTTVGAFSLGLAQGALDLAIARAKSRVQFGKPLSKFQAIQFKLADMATSVQAARLMIYHAAGLRDTYKENDIEPSMESSMAKMFATENAFKVINEAVQIFGGDGVIKNSKILNFLLISRSPIIYEGTSEIQRIIIARELLSRT